MTPMVKAEQVCKSFGALEVLKGITLEVGKGQVLVMVGPSGSGKSTFLRCINHLEVVNAGRLYVDGDLIGYRDRGNKLYEISPRVAAKQRAEDALRDKSGHISQAEALAELARTTAMLKFIQKLRKP